MEALRARPLGCSLPSASKFSDEDGWLPCVMALSGFDAWICDDAPRANGRWLATLDAEEAPTPAPYDRDRVIYDAEARYASHAIDDLAGQLSEQCGDPEAVRRLTTQIAHLASGLRYKAERMCAPRKAVW